MDEEAIRRFLEEENDDDSANSNDDVSTSSESFKPSEGSSDSSDFESSNDENEENIDISNIPQTRPTDNVIWLSPATGSTLKSFHFVAPSTSTAVLSSPYEYYQLFVTDDILNLIVTETNRNAQKVISQNRINRNSRLKSWKDTDAEEIKMFFALILYMGLVKYPSIEGYWSQNILYCNKFVSSIMPRNRFQLLLRFIHFADNDQESVTSSRLYKIDQLIQKMILNFKKSRCPPDNIVIDETMVPYRGRIGFRQYIPGKRKEYGLKLFKLTDPNGYTYNVQVYTGKSNHTTGLSLATMVCSQLIGEYFHQGRTLTVDNFYTSLELANFCLARSTHLQGTLRKTRKGVPTFPIQTFKKGDVITKEKEGVVVGVWKDKRIVSFLSTKDNGEMVASEKRTRSGAEIKKPNVILSYNKSKQGIDLSDQLASHFSPLRKTVRWYHKIAFELLLNTAVINAYILYNEDHPTEKLQVADFRKSLILALSRVITPSSVESLPAKHVLAITAERTKDNRRKRKRCVQCYADLSAVGGPHNARKKAKLVDTFCNYCPGKPYFCLEHFQIRH